MQSMLASAMSEIDPNSFQVTDEDLDDPSFLSELNDLAGEAEGSKCNSFLKSFPANYIIISLQPSMGVLVGEYCSQDCLR